MEGGSCALRALPGVLLGKMWPGECAFLGLRVSKWLREDLTTHLLECRVQIPATESEGSGVAGESALSVAELCKGLTRFPQSALRLRVEGSGDAYLADSFVRAMLQAAPLGLNKSLVQLDISGTQIDDTQASFLRSVLEQCSSLSHLRLMNTGGGGFAQAVECVEALGSSSLSHLDLSHPIGMHGLIEERMNGHGQLWQKRLACLSSQCQQLSVLNVAGCSLCGTSGMLPAMLRQCTCLTTLDLGGNCLEDEEVREIARELARQCTSVTHLSLRKNTISDASAQSLSDFLSRCPGLRHLDLGSTKLGCKGTQTLGTSLGACTALAHLDLSDAAIGQVGAEALADALKVCSALTYLDVSHQPASSALLCMQLGAPAEERWPKLTTLRLRKANITSQSVGPVADALKRMPAMRVLDLSHNDLEPEGVRQLAIVLPLCRRLSSLALRCVAAGGEGASALAAVLGECEGLEDLDLSWNQMGGAGAAAVVGAMGQCLRLRTLALGYNAMGSEGATALSKALRTCSVTAVDVSDNLIGAAGAGEIARGLRGCSSLRSLDLSRNQIGAEGGRRLAEGLGEGKGCLEQLSLNRCAIGGEGSVAMAKALERCVTLARLDLSCNGIGVAGAEELCARAKGMRRLAELDLRNNGLAGGGAGKERLRALVAECAARVRWCLRD